MQCMNLSYFAVHMLSAPDRWIRAVKTGGNISSLHWPLRPIYLTRKAHRYIHTALVYDDKQLSVVHKLSRRGTFFWPMYVRIRQSVLGSYAIIKSVFKVSDLVCVHEQCVEGDWFILHPLTVCSKRRDLRFSYKWCARSGGLCCVHSFTVC